MSLAPGRLIIGVLNNVIDEKGTTIIKIANAFKGLLEHDKKTQNAIVANTAA